MSTIPENITPAQLRTEAEKRELVGRWDEAMRARTARNEIVDAIEEMVATHSTAIGRVRAGHYFEDAVRGLEKADAHDMEHLPSNAEISHAGTNWWQQREKLERPEEHRIFGLIRNRNWSPRW